MSPIVSWLRRSVGRDINKRCGFMLLSIGDSDAAFRIAMARRGEAMSSLCQIVTLFMSLLEIPGKIDCLERSLP